MRIVCPTCSAAYDVPDSRITAGRVVRCARCSGEWMPVENAPALAAAEPPARDAESPSPEERSVTVTPLVGLADTPGAQFAPQPRVSAMDRLASHPAGPQSRLRLRLAWAASLVLLSLGAWSAYGWRSQIVEVWPPSARMYAVFGMHPGASSTH